MRSKLAATLVLAAVVSLVALSSALTPQTGPPPRGKGILDVQVYDENRKPLSGVLVAVPGYRSTTGLAGTCRFGLLPGRYSVLISKPGYRGRRVNAGVRPGETTTTRVQLQKLPPARYSRK